MRATHLLAFGLIACAAPHDGPRVMVEGDGFFDRPFPSDDRMVDGHPDLSDFQGADEYDLLQSYIDQTVHLRGFGPNSPVYLRFDGPLDPTPLPSPAESRSVGAAMFLLNVDPRSPHRGERVPIEWDLQDTETQWQPENLLAAQPVWGRPMRPGTTYALVLTTDIAQPDPDFVDSRAADHPDHDRHAAVWDTLFGLQVDPERIAYATTFTTGSPVDEMARLAWRVQNDVSVPPLDQTLVRAQRWPLYNVYQGEMFLPIWQQGTTPFFSEGGGFAFDEDGHPLLGSWERVEFTLTVPNRVDPPAAGWPVVFYGHGTGGDRLTFADSNSRLEPASVFALSGMAGFSISLPFHGNRNTGVDPALASFNYFNPESGRCTFRQAALEQLYVVEALTRHANHFVDDSDLDLTLDPARVAYMGHSHGGETGLIAIPFFGERVAATVISGAGGGLSLSLTGRDAGDFEIQDLLTSTFDFDSDEELDHTHPLTGMVQLLSEATDPLNYGPYWHRWEPWWDTSPAHVLQFEGMDDSYTPPVASEAQAGAVGHPILSPVLQQSTVQLLTDIDGEDTPAEDNIRAWDGSRVTGGVAQFEPGEYDGHFVVFYDDAAAAMYQGFLESALLDDDPRIPERDD